MLADLIRKNRSYRRFHQSEQVAPETLTELIDLARLTASGANVQPLKYATSADAEVNARIFPHLKWAGYLTDWAGPAEGERPAAYVVLLWDTRVRPVQASYDPGIAAQTIMLGAAERGLGGCIIASIGKRELSAVLDLDPRFEILLVLALGKPAETVVIEEMGEGGDCKYWRDERQVHHVPKRRLEDIIVRRWPA